MLEGGEAPAQRIPAEPAREGAMASPPPPGPGPAPAEALDLGSIGGAVVADRLKDPQTVAGIALVVFLLGFLLGRKGR